MSEREQIEMFMRVQMLEVKVESLVRSSRIFSWRDISPEERSDFIRAFVVKVVCPSVIVACLVPAIVVALVIFCGQL